MASIESCLLHNRLSFETGAPRSAPGAGALPIRCCAALAVEPFSNATGFLLSRTLTPGFCCTCNNRISAGALTSGVSFPAFSRKLLLLPGASIQIVRFTIARLRGGAPRSAPGAGALPIRCCAPAALRHAVLLSNLRALTFRRGRLRNGAPGDSIDA
jgi:hypothetical protein